MMRLTTIGLLALLMGEYALARIAPDLPRTGSNSSPIIVRYTAGALRSSRGPASLGKLRARARFAQLDMVHADATPAEVAELLTDPAVEYVSPDRPVQGAGTMKFTPYWIRKVVQHDATSHPSGKGIGVAIVDSGITFDNSFQDATCRKSRIVFSKSFISKFADDAYGHGTHVAGIIGANPTCFAPDPSAVSSNSLGLAHNANIINLRALDDTGKGTDSSVIAAIDWAVTNKALYNVRVMNLSLGRPVRESYKTDPLCQAVERAWKAGIFVTVSAGNSGRDNSRGAQGYGTIASPGNDPYVLTVGALRTVPASETSISTRREWSTAATYSSKGPTLGDHIVKPDLVAPGNLVASRMDAKSRLVSTYSFWLWMEVTPTVIVKYPLLSGTSMAAPVAAGVAAGLLERDPTLTPDQIKALLMRTAWKGLPSSVSIVDGVTGVPYYVEHDAFTIGAGVIDAAAAFAATEKAPLGQLALSPTATVVNGKVQMTNTTVAGTNVIWGTGVWSNNVIWGDAIVSSLNVIWGENVIWGDATNAAYNVIWGDNVVWGDSDPYSEALSIAGDR